MHIDVFLISGRFNRANDDTKCPDASSDNEQPGYVSSSMLWIQSKPGR